MKTAKQWLDEMSPENNYGKPSISLLDYIERIQHDVQDDFTKQVAELKAENARLASELTNYKLGFATANEELARLRAALEAKP